MRSARLPGWLRQFDRAYRRDRAIVADSGFFDAAWYRQTYPGAAGWDPLDHYLVRGRAERTSPGPRFDAPAYLAANPDIAAEGHDPLVHYIEFGRRERRPLGPGQG